MAAALVALFVPVIVLANVGLPFSAAGIKEVSGGVGILDLEPAATAEGVGRALAAYGQEGRERYLVLLASLDVLLPLLLALTCAALLGVTLGRVRALRWTPLTPLVGLAADYAENGVLAVLLTGYPSVPAGPAGLLSTLTAVKTTAIAVELALVGAGLLYAALTRPARRRAGAVP
ncbi:hypothetical protein GCM10017600_71220 [Streptosporangium carneum]|uniref:Uncharacterized protein n=1 Tax=Streptosporangium carneum TaxID=47481 RepID=A0A9W6I7W3_9ACTN|nr:hypothetical protein GCM10017600_71220 [Streptosporangium carneum]